MMRTRSAQLWIADGKFSLACQPWPPLAPRAVCTHKSRQNVSQLATRQGTLQEHVVLLDVRTLVAELPHLGCRDTMILQSLHT